MKEIIVLQLKDILKNIGIENVEITLSPKAEMGDFAFPVFSLAKEQGRNPAELAEEIFGKLALISNPLIDRVAAFGPYVNFFLNTGELAKLILTEIALKQENFGANKIGQGKSVMIEYPSNNTHKEFHIGHLRNVCIGNTLVNLYRKSGYTVVPVNYLNDFGSHVAKCLWGVTKLYDGIIPEGNRQKWLGEVYAEASSAVKENDEYKKEVSAIQQKLEAGESEITKLFQETRDWSIEKFNELFAELGVHHETTFYESTIKAAGQKTVDELLQKGIAQVGEGGAIIIDLSKEKLDVALLRKSDGTGLYLTSDIPLAKEKFEKYDVDESIVITGIEQNFYFKQLYKILEMLGFKKKFTHIGYGLVTKPEGKMSSRLGNVVLYEDLRDEIADKMYRESQERHPDWNQDVLIDTVKKLSQASLKFTLQKHEASKNIVFDLKDATSFEGYTGPYILYVLARINSLLRKAGERNETTNFALLKETEEKNILLLLAEYEGIIQKALENYNPSVIAKYSFDVAQAFNEFYNKHEILKAENKELVDLRLFLCEAVKIVVTNSLSLLTIQTVDEM
jgi:arginyl-tRNA synthetase